MNKKIKCILVKPNVPSEVIEIEKENYFDELYRLCNCEYLQAKEFHSLVDGELVAYFDEDGKLKEGAVFNRTLSFEQEFVDVYGQYHPQGEVYDHIVGNFVLIKYDGQDWEEPVSMNDDEIRKVIHYFDEVEKMQEPENDMALGYTM